MFPCWFFKLHHFQTVFCLKQHQLGLRLCNRLKEEACSCCVCWEIGVDGSVSRFRGCFWCLCKRCINIYISKHSALRLVCYFWTSEQTLRFEDPSVCVWTFRMNTMNRMSSWNMQWFISYLALILFYVTDLRAWLSGCRRVNLCCVWIGILAYYFTRILHNIYRTIFKIQPLFHEGCFK